MAPTLEGRQAPELALMLVYASFELSGSGFVGGLQNSVGGCGAGLRARDNVIHCLINDHGQIWPLTDPPADVFLSAEGDEGRVVTTADDLGSERAPDVYRLELHASGSLICYVELRSGQPAALREDSSCSVSLSAST